MPNAVKISVFRYVVVLQKFYEKLSQGQFKKKKFYLSVLQKPKYLPITVEFRYYMSGIHM